MGGMYEVGKHEKTTRRLKALALCFCAEVRVKLERLGEVDSFRGISSLAQ